jgi:hypothetical protein
MDHARSVSDAAPIVVVTKPLPPSELAKFLGAPFPDMVKFVVDVERRVVAVGGSLHADAEALLIDQGSRQAALWGGNYYPGLAEATCIEYESLINIRPGRNPGVTVEDETVRARIRDLVFSLVGKGRPRP